MSFKYIDPSQPVTKLTGGVILKVMLDLLKKTSGDAANRFRKDLLAAWNWGMEYLDPPLQGPNPCKVKKMPAAEKPRYVPPEEDFWKLYDYVSDADKVMLLTFIHTAGRKKEIFSLKWEDVDFENKSIRLWTRKRNGANYESDWIPMVKELCDALEWWRKNTPIQESPFVFNCVEATKVRDMDFLLRVVGPTLCGIIANVLVLSLLDSIRSDTSGHLFYLGKIVPMLLYRKSSGTVIQ
jgi:integrase